jgi:putative addiction module component (TIGR02574 family)
MPLPLIIAEEKSRGMPVLRLWRCFMHNHNTEEIIQEAASLPVEERIIVVDSLLRTLNMPDPDIDREWAVVARRRLAELRSGRVKPVPGDDVFTRIRERFGR